MKKQLLVASVLLLMSATVSLAQGTMGNIVSGGATGGDINYAPNGQVHTETSATWTTNMTMGVGKELIAQTGATLANTKLMLKSNALMLEKHDGGLESHSTELWSVGLAAPAKQLEFTTDGNLLVRGQDGKMLWQTGTGGRGKKLVIHVDGKVEIQDNSGVIWSK